MKSLSRVFLSLSLTFVLYDGAFLAVAVPFQEDFTSGSSFWTNFNNSALVTFHGAGGPDGSSYVSGEFNFENSVFGDQGPVIFRGETTPLGPASGGNFFGDWMTDGVREFRAFVRHNALVPLNYFTRFADPVNFPGATAVLFAPVFPHTWTELVFAIHPSSPNFVTFEGQSFATVFDKIGRLQIGVSIPAALAGVDQSFTFDLDQVAIRTPEPATGIVGGLSALLLLAHRGKKHHTPSSRV